MELHLVLGARGTCYHPARVLRIAHDGLRACNGHDPSSAPRLRREVNHVGVLVADDVEELLTKLAYGDLSCVQVWDLGVTIGEFGEDLFTKLAYGDLSCVQVWDL